MSISWGEFEEFCRLLIPFVDFERLLKDRVKPRGSAARCIEKDKEREGVETETPDWGSDAEHPRQNTHVSHSGSTTFNEMVAMAAQIYGETHRIVQEEISRRRAASPAADVKITEVETEVTKETLRADKRDVVSVATDAPPPPIPMRVLKTPPVAPKKMPKKLLPAKQDQHHGSKSSSYSSSSSSSPTKPRRRKRRSNDGSSRHDKRRDAKSMRKRRSKAKKPITAERKQSKMKSHTVELKRPPFHKNAFGRRAFYSHAPTYGASPGYTNPSSYGQKEQQEGAQPVQAAAASSGHNYHGHGHGYHGYGYQ